MNTNKLDDVALLQNRAVDMLRGGMFSDAVKLLEDGAKKFPDSADLFNLLGAAYLQTDQVDPAAKAIKKSLALRPDDLKTLSNYGVLLLRQNKLDKAAELYRKLVTLDPKAAEFHNNLGQILLSQGHLEEAGKALQNTLFLNPRHANATLGIATVLKAEHRNDEALRAFRQALALNPAMEKSWFALASHLEFMGGLEEAEKIIGDALRRFPASLALPIVRARILRRQKKHAEALTYLESLLPALRHQPQRSGEFYREIAQLYDKAERYDYAFRYFYEANKLDKAASEEKAVDANELPKKIARCRKNFTKDFVESYAPIAARNVQGGMPKPVFMVGFPRSGTTLLHRLLASHPAISVTEEEQIVPELARRIGTEYPKGLESLDSNAVAELRQTFFDLHKRRGSNLKKPILIDRLPFSMIDAGLINRIFPEAKFILALRHPFDCVMSAWMQDFAPNAATVHFYDLADAARLYDSMFDVWMHYESLLPLSVIPVRYEDVVADDPATLGKVIGQLGIPQDDAMFIDDGKLYASNTASYHQVNEKLYADSINRWKHYPEAVREIGKILTPWAKRYGYET
jgi:tetratricopeptide (TPR) repeat protein